MFTPAMVDRDALKARRSEGIITEGLLTDMTVMDVLNKNRVWVSETVWCSSVANISFIVDSAAGLPYSYSSFGRSGPFYDTEIIDGQIILRNKKTKKRTIVFDGLQLDFGGLTGIKRVSTTRGSKDYLVKCHDYYLYGDNEKYRVKLRIHWIIKSPELGDEIFDAMGMYERKIDINHLSGDNTENSDSNLDAGTHSENMKHYHKELKKKD